MLDSGDARGYRRVQTMQVTANGRSLPGEAAGEHFPRDSKALIPLNAKLRRVSMTASVAIGLTC